MNQELKETVLQLADYSNEEKARLLRRMHRLFWGGFLGFVVFLVILALGLDEAPPYESIGSCGLGFAFGVMMIGLIFTSRHAARIRAFKLRMLGKTKEEKR